MTRAPRVPATNDADQLCGRAWMIFARWRMWVHELLLRQHFPHPHSVKWRHLGVGARESKNRSRTAATRSR